MFTGWNGTWITSNSQTGRMIWMACRRRRSSTSSAQTKTSARESIGTPRLGADVFLFYGCGPCKISPLRSNDFYRSVTVSPDGVPNVDLGKPGFHDDKKADWGSLAAPKSGRGATTATAASSSSAPTLPPQLLLWPSTRTLGTTTVSKRRTRSTS